MVGFGKKKGSAMNKKEFKEMYAAARLIRNAAHARGCHKNAGTNKAWNICHDVINAMPIAVSGAVWGWLSICASDVYPISQNKWASEHNSRAFGAVKCRSRGTL